MFLAFVEQFLHCVCKKALFPGYFLIFCGWVKVAGGQEIAAFILVFQEGDGIGGNAEGAIRFYGDGDSWRGGIKIIMGFGTGNLYKPSGKGRIGSGA